MEVVRAQIYGVHQGRIVVGSTRELLRQGSRVPVMAATQHEQDEQGQAGVDVGTESGRRDILDELDATTIALLHHMWEHGETDVEVEVEVEVESDVEAGDGPGFDLTETGTETKTETRRETQYVTNTQEAREALNLDHRESVKYRFEKLADLGLAETESGGLDENGAPLPKQCILTERGETLLRHEDLDRWMEQAPESLYEQYQQLKFRQKRMEEAWTNEFVPRYFALQSYVQWLNTEVLPELVNRDGLDVPMPPSLDDLEDDIPVDVRDAERDEIAEMFADPQAQDGDDE